MSSPSEVGVPRIPSLISIRPPKHRKQRCLLHIYISLYSNFHQLMPIVFHYLTWANSFTLLTSNVKELSIEFTILIRVHITFWQSLQREYVLFKSLNIKVLHSIEESKAEPLGQIQEHRSKCFLSLVTQNRFIQGRLVFFQKFIFQKQKADGTSDS